MAYVSQDGSYGTDKVIVFDYDDLTNAQWDTLDELGDSQRYAFVADILNGKETN